MLIRTNLPDLYLADALPWIEQLIEEEHEAYPYISEQIFNIRDMKHGIAQHSQVSALSPAAEVSEGEEIPQDRVYQGYSTTYTATKYGLMLSTSQESIDDEKHDSIMKNPKKMARAMASTREIQAAAVFNNAFSTTGSDGKTLCATDHPLLAPGAGTSSNRLATDADLDSTSLKDLLTLFRKIKDTAGNRIHVEPACLLVPSELEHTAFTLLNSNYATGGSTNDVSSFGPQGIFRLKPLVWNYLTDADAFFLLSEKDLHDLYWFWAKQPKVESSMDFKTESALTKMTARWAVGYSDWRGVAGTSGAD